jgi:hypothetical protein
MPGGQYLWLSDDGIATPAGDSTSARLMCALTLSSTNAAGQESTN